MYQPADLPKSAGILTYLIEKPYFRKLKSKFYSRVKD